MLYNFTSILGSLTLCFIFCFTCINAHQIFLLLQNQLGAYKQRTKEFSCPDFDSNLNWRRMRDNRSLSDFVELSIGDSEILRDTMRMRCKYILFRLLNCFWQRHYTAILVGTFSNLYVQAPQHRMESRATGQTHSKTLGNAWKIQLSTIFTLQFWLGANLSWQRSTKLDIACQQSTPLENVTKRSIHLSRKLRGFGRSFM